MKFKIVYAKNFLKALYEHVESGFEHVPYKVQEERYAICHEPCENLDEEADRCLHCGCFLKEKKKWKTSKCPINKW